jgi:hypothetical protein
MKHAIISFLFLSLLTVSSLAEAKTFGAGVTLPKMTQVSEIMNNPKEYVGKKVKIKGLVVDVCAKRGCWLYIAGDKPFQKIQIKVDDGVIVFPMSARGKVATVEGVVEKLDMTHEEAITYHKHLAEERGQKFNPASVKGNEATYRIRGTGSEIEGL